MSKLSARKGRVKRTVSIGKVAPEAVGQVEDLDGRIEAIQWLIPLAPMNDSQFSGRRSRNRGSGDPILSSARSARRISLIGYEIRTTTRE